jgi:hypothetical protein
VNHKVNDEKDGFRVPCSTTDLASMDMRGELNGSDYDFKRFIQ